MTDGRQYQAGEDMDARARVKRLEAECERLRELPKSLRGQADHAHKYRSYPYYSGQMAAFREAAHQIERAYDTPEIKPENCEECGGLGHSSEAAGMHCPHCNGTGNAPHTPEQTAEYGEITESDGDMGLPGMWEAADFVGGPDDTPENGDALAALDRILLRGDNAKCGDFQIVRKALTDRGVPEEDAAHDKGKAEGIRAGWNAGYAQGHNDANRDHGHAQLYTLPNEDILKAAEAMKREALASAPADGYKEKYHELLYAVATKHPGESRHETALRYIQNAESGSNCQAAAAPADGREYE